MSRIIVWRNTSVLTDEVVRDLIERVAPPGIPLVDIVARNTKYPASGYCYPFGTERFARPPSRCQRPLLVVQINPNPAFYPKKMPKAHPDHVQAVLRDQFEALAFVAAHEARHLWQAHSPAWYGWLDERDADLWAEHALNQYRRLTNGTAERRRSGAPSLGVPNRERGGFRRAVDAGRSLPLSEGRLHPGPLLHGRLPDGVRQDGEGDGAGGLRADDAGEADGDGA